MDVSPDSAETETAAGILIVDDRPENRLALKAILSAASYRVVEASSGAEALRRLLDEDFAMLMIDVVMPEMNGFELATAIRERERTAAIPILFLTAEASDLDLLYKAYRLGAVDYLIKPLIPEMVRAKTAVFTQLYQQRKRLERQAALLLEAQRKESDHHLLELRVAGERRYRNLAEAVPQIIWTAQPDGRVDYFNQRWFEHTGVTADQADGSWRRPVHPDDLLDLEEGWRAARIAGRMFEAECRLRGLATGAFRWHLCRAVPERGSSGQIISWLGTFTDIDDQKRVQAVLAEFRATLDAVLDAVMIFEPRTWRVLYVNQGASALFGYGAEELSRMHLRDLMKDCDETLFRELLAPLQDQARISLETQCRRGDGREIPVEFSFQLVRVDEVHVVSIARDISERRLAQLEREQLYREALAGIEARDEFLSVASHELRTPLSTLTLQLEMMTRPPRRATQSGILSGQALEKVQAMERQVARLTGLISQLMDVSRIRAGRLQLDREDVDLALLVGDVVSRHKDDAAKAGSPVTFNQGENVHGQWDRMRVEQVITNLLTNALKYGAGRPVEVTVSAGESSATFGVRDQGIGIASEDAERIFQRFERAAPTKTYAGLGLGLYIVRRIVDAHGGSIRVDSEPGVGSIFTVDLPYEPPPSERDDGQEGDGDGDGDGDGAGADRDPPSRADA